MADESEKLAALLGLTEYEGRVYRALLQEPGTTAYRLGKRSGVPLSRVYEVAERLAAKGAAVREDGEPARYTAVDPDSLVGTARARITLQLDSLAEELASLQLDSDSAAPVWIRGEERVLGQLAGAASSAESEIILMGAPAILARIRQAMRTTRQVRVRSQAFPSKSQDANTFVVLVDHKTAIIGRLGKNADALITSHPAAVQLAAGYASQFMEQPTQPKRIPVTAQPSAFHESTGWLGWEEEKHRRLLRH